MISHWEIFLGLIFITIQFVCKQFTNQKKKTFDETEVSILSTTDKIEMFSKMTFHFRIINADGFWTDRTVTFFFNHRIWKKRESWPTSQQQVVVELVLGGGFFYVLILALIHFWRLMSSLEGLPLYLLPTSSLLKKCTSYVCIHIMYLDPPPPAGVQPLSDPHPVQLTTVAPLIKLA